MDGGVENETGVTLSGIERCPCPSAYTGYSCEASISTAVIRWCYIENNRQQKFYSLPNRLSSE